MAENMEKPSVVGMDIGGTNTVFGVVDSRGNVLASDSIKTQQHDDVNEYVESVCAKLIPMIEKFGGPEKIKGMGVGAPNGNYYSGTIEFAPNLPWKGVIPLAAMFEERLGIPTALTNDANAAAIGEMTYGAARGMKDFIMITLGTGVGSGIVINGQLVYGHDGFAGELGHVMVEKDGRIVNLSLLLGSWYIDQLKRAAYETPAVPISFNHEQYRESKRDIVFIMERYKQANLKEVIEFVASDLPQTKLSGYGEPLDYVPTRKVIIRGSYRYSAKAPSKYHPQQYPAELLSDFRMCHHGIEQKIIQQIQLF